METMAAWMCCLLGRSKHEADTKHTILQRRLSSARVFSPAIEW